MKAVLNFLLRLKEKNLYSEDMKVYFQIFVLITLMLGLLGTPTAHAFGLDQNSVCASCVFEDQESPENNDADNSSDPLHAAGHHCHHHNHLMGNLFQPATQKSVSSFLSVYQSRIKPSPVYGLKRPPRMAA